MGVCSDNLRLYERAAQPELGFVYATCPYVVEKEKVYLGTFQRSQKTLVVANESPLGFYLCCYCCLTMTKSTCADKNSK
jgi:hypothetical protein